MANAMYELGREGFLAGSISWSGDTIKAALVDTSAYTVNLTTHQYYSSVSGVVGTPQTLGTKTVSLGVADAADVTYTALTGNSCEAIVIYKDTGVAGTSPLIAYIDTATNLPVTPNGGDVGISWDNGANKIFKL